METKIKRQRTVEEIKIIKDCINNCFETRLKIEALTWISEPNRKEKTLLMEQIKKLQQIQAFYEEQLTHTHA